MMTALSHSWLSFSTGIFGEKRPMFCRLLISNLFTEIDSVSCRISLRPTDTANLFNFVIGGNVDHIRLSSDEDSLKKFLMDNVGSETELKLGDIPWLSAFTCVQSFCNLFLFKINVNDHALIGQTFEWSKPFSREGSFL